MQAPAPGNEFAREVHAGLSGFGQKTLPCRYLYDSVGSALFEAITYLSEYGLTRADARILEAHAAEITGCLAGPLAVAELGSGSGIKTRSLLESLRERRPVTYYPIDLSATALEHCARELEPFATVVPIEKGYLEGMCEVASHRRGEAASQHGGEEASHHGAGEVASHRRGEAASQHGGEEASHHGAGEAASHRGAGEKLLLLFLGSTIGNFEAGAASEFLTALRAAMCPGDGLLLGTDLVKPVDRLLAAYDDAAGVTAAFNLNLLARINRELDGDFNLRQFHHEARYHAEAQRIEMHLRSRAQQTVRIGKAGLSVQFAVGETILTEVCHKFRADQIAGLARSAGFRLERQWVDEEWGFAESLLRV
jgi:uncharacterized SAM-dependent methyltransferase